MTAKFAPLTKYAPPWKQCPRVPVPLVALSLLAELGAGLPVPHRRIAAAASPWAGHRETAALAPAFLTINDTTTASDTTPHTGQLAPGRPHYREVPWLPGQTPDRDTAMILAGIAAPTGLHQGHRLWPAIQSRAAGLALTAPGAIMRASGPPGKTSSQLETGQS